MKQKTVAELKRKFSIPDAPVDLLFVGKAREYKNQLIDYMASHGVKVENAAEVIPDLYPPGGTINGEISPRVYGVNDGIDSGEYKFTGDELNPKNILIIVNESIRYGRQFREICTVLERYLRRDLKPGSKSPTFAFFRKVIDEDFSFDPLAENVLIPVEEGIIYY